MKVGEAPSLIGRKGEENGMLYLRHFCQKLSAFARKALELFTFEIRYYRVSLAGVAAFEECGNNALWNASQHTAHLFRGERIIAQKNIINVFERQRGADIRLLEVVRHSYLAQHFM